MGVIVKDMMIPRQTCRFLNSFGDITFEMATVDFLGDLFNEKNHKKTINVSREYEFSL